MHSMKIVQAANDFRIWRAGNSVKWDCTYAEIASEVGLTRETVQLTCKRRGWKTNQLQNTTGRYGVNEVDTAFCTPYGLTR